MSVTLDIAGGQIECPEKFSAPSWQALYKAILQDRLSGVQQVKHDATTTVYFACYEGVELVIKRYNTKNTWHFLRRGFRLSRADICYRMAAHYLHAGISTPQPIAAIQAFAGPFKLRSWYLSHRLPGESFDQAITKLNHHPPTPEMRSAVTGMFKSLHQHHLSHGDMKASNLIWDNGDISVIDLDAARSYHWQKRHEYALKKDLLRFLDNWPPKSPVSRAFKQSFTEATLLPLD